jgi:ABC-type dipeptide/oligopeptide/nickel transport system ATPase component
MFATWWVRLNPSRRTVMTGTVHVGGHDLVAASERQLPDIRGRVVSMIFQEPMTALDPMFTIGRQIRETRRRHEPVGPRTIVRVHVLPNVLGPVFVYATSLISVSMILASGLSFLGLGTRPPDAESGLMLNTPRTAIYTQPVNAMLPGLCIS